MKTKNGYFKWMQTLPDFVKTFIEAVEKYPEVICVIVEQTEVFHITTFVAPPLENIEDRVYNAEYALEFVGVPVNWHLKETHKCLKKLRPHKNTLVIWFSGIPETKKGTP